MSREYSLAIIPHRGVTSDGDGLVNGWSIYKNARCLVVNVDAAEAAERVTVVSLVRRALDVDVVFQTLNRQERKPERKTDAEEVEVVQM